MISSQEGLELTIPRSSSSFQDSDSLCSSSGFQKQVIATQWRGPLGMYLIWPTLLIVIAYLSPESPRWLALQGREQEAREVIFRLHTVWGDDTFAKGEWSEIQRQTTIDLTLQTSWVSSLFLVGLTVSMHS